MSKTEKSKLKKHKIKSRKNLRIRRTRKTKKTRKTRKVIKGGNNDIEMINNIKAMLKGNICNFNCSDKIIQNIINYVNAVKSPTTPERVKRERDDNPPTLPDSPNVESPGERTRRFRTNDAIRQLRGFD